MINLPKRGDTIYEEIKNFEPYEYTNCIAYEMAIRNERSLNIKKYITENNLFYIGDNYIEKEFRELGSMYDWFFENSKKIEFQFSNEQFYSGMNLSQVKHGKRKALRFYLEKNLIYKCDVLDETIDFGAWLDTRIKLNIKESDIEETIDMLMNITEEESVFQYTFERNEKEDSYRPLKQLENCTLDYLSSEFVNLLKLEDFKSLTFSSVLFYSREKLIFEKSQESEIKLNLNLPIEELTAYIAAIKDEYDNDNSIIKNPLELLGEDFEKSNNKKINKKLIADKFFIYDYVTSRLEQIKEDNLSMYEEYEEQKQEIMNNEYIDSSDRKIQLKELKREFEENTNTRVPEILEDIEGFSSGTAKRYYYDIKPFIDDCKYKELITGITTK